MPVTIADVTKALQCDDTPRPELDADLHAVLTGRVPAWRLASDDLRRDARRNHVVPVLHDGYMLGAPTEAPAYTSSVDAALRFCPPGWWLEDLHDMVSWKAGDRESISVIGATCWLTSVDDVQKQGQAASKPVAIVEAALLAWHHDAGDRPWAASA